MKNVFKMLGIMCIIAAVLFIAGCGEPEDPTYTVTFDSNGGTAVATQSGIAKDGLATKPANPSKTTGSTPTTAGFWKLASGTITFTGWYEDGSDEPFDFDTPITKNITLKARYSGDEPDNLTSSVISTGVKKLSTVITWLNTGSNAGATDKFVLLLDAGTNDENGAIVMNKGNLTIKGIGGSTGTDQVKIKSAYEPTATASNLVFLTVGETSKGTTTPTLTLNNIIVEGLAGTTEDAYGVLSIDSTNSKAVGDSLVRVRYGATLNMEKGSSIRGHRSSATSGNGTNGNGSALCIYGGNLTMNGGATVEANESSANFTTPTNKNRVGGVYTYTPFASGTSGPTVPVDLKISGGIINNNKCTTGNTADLYATEGGTFALSGSTTIGELTINADPSGANAVPAAIVVSGLNNPVGISLRSTAAVSTVKTTWDGKHVLLGAGGTLTSPTAPAAGDLAKFTLKQFKGGASETGPGYEDIKADEYEIDTDGTLKKLK